MKCYECGKETDNEEVSDNGATPHVYCDDCLTGHEYSTTCPNCDIRILVN